MNRYKDLRIPWNLQFVFMTRDDTIHANKETSFAKDSTPVLGNKNLNWGGQKCHPHSHPKPPERAGAGERDRHAPFGQVWARRHDISDFNLSLALLVNCNFCTVDKTSEQYAGKAELL